MPNEGHLGPLTTTFLLSMASPIITLPIERILKNYDREDDAYVDDRFLNSDLSTGVKSLFDTGRFSEAPFFESNAWAFSQIHKKEEPINLAKNFPNELAQDLSSELAAQRASNMEFKQWIACIRNSLAHGGIAYLDETGSPTYAKPAQMYAFVSGKYDKQGTLLAIRVLRIGERHFREFLTKWVEWLERIGIAQALAA